MENTASEVGIVKNQEVLLFQELLVALKTFVDEAIPLFKQENQHEIGSIDFFKLTGFLEDNNLMIDSINSVYSELRRYFHQREEEDLDGFYSRMLTDQKELEKHTPAITYTNVISQAFVIGISSEEISEALTEHYGLEPETLLRLFHYFERILKLPLGEKYFTNANIKQFIHATINNVPVLALVDTGSNVNCIDSRFLNHSYIAYNRHNSEMTYHGQGVVTLSGWGNVDVSFDGHVFKDESCVVVEEANEAVIFGLPLLSKSSRIRLAYGGRYPTLNVDSCQFNRPTVSAVLNKHKPLDALLDSGAEDNWIDRKTAEEINVETLQLETPIEMMLAAGKSSLVSTYCICNLKVNGLYYESTRFYITAKLGHSVLLGEAFLSLHEEVAIEYNGKGRELKFSFHKPLCLREC